MANTFSHCYNHIVFSTKNREPIITSPIRAELYAYIGGICRNLESPLLAAGGMPDHVHLLVSLSKNIALSKLLMDIKKDSSKWIKTKGRSFADFQWQEGYGGFSIGASGVPRLKEYIAGQKEHHQKRSFREEFIALLRKYGIEFDERYVVG